jgi:transposase
VRNATLWRAVLGVEKTVVADVEFDEVEQVLVARPAEAARDQTLRAVQAAVPGL